jgi:hypothetical protein
MNAEEGTEEELPALLEKRNKNGSDLMLHLVLPLRFLFFFVRAGLFHSHTSKHDHYIYIKASLNESKKNERL